MRRALSRLWIVDWIAGAYLLLVACILRLSGMDFTFLPLLLSYLRFVLAVTVVVLALSIPILLLRWRRDGASAVGNKLSWFFRAIPALLLTLIAYTNLKVHLLQFNPRLWDRVLARIDGVIHFGLTERLVASLPELAGPLSNALMDRAYFLAWLAFAIPLAVLWGRGEGPAVRRALAALQLCYLIGGFLYLAFPALGPAFVERADFAVLRGTVAFTRQAEMLRALRYVVAHPGAAAIPFFGVAAFPSLHLATASLGAVAAWHHWRPLLFLLVPWNLLIGLSTVYLGWHYAVDLYPGVLLAMACWYLAGRLQPPAVPTPAPDGGS